MALRCGRPRRGPIVRTPEARRSAAAIASSSSGSSLPQLLAPNASASTGRALPASASHASTAVRTAKATTPLRSSPMASASPTRRIAALSSPRWRLTSSIVVASCSDMLLNSRPSWANSSRPATGTGCLKSPRARRRAATRKVSICCVRARLTMPADSMASTRKASSSAPTTSRLREIVSDSDAVLRKTASSKCAPPASATGSTRPRNSSPATWKPCGRPRAPSSRRDSMPVMVAASSLPSRKTPTSLPVRMLTRRANLRAVVTETSSVPRMESPATSGAALAAIPVDEPARAISRPEPAVRSSIVTTPRLPTSCRMRAWTPRLVAIAWVRRGSEAT